MEKRKINIPKTIWISSIFAFLIAVLIMVMDYKINYQYSNSGTNKLYFYNCNNELCTSESKMTNKKLYSEYTCYGVCPSYKGKIDDEYALLKNNDEYILYNYKKGIKISEGYDEYIPIDSEYIIVKKKDLEGIINIENTVVINIEYNQVGYYKNNKLIGYNTENIIIKKGNEYGIINYKTGIIVEEIKYKENDINKLLEIINNK
ncbi:MAG: hypothetical protein IJI49_05735 [Bacilli bacterium]|nr:hypothetical protein [Bacilli bacterium]